MASGSAENTFLKIFETEPSPPSTARASRSPDMPSETSVSADSIDNYKSLGFWSNRNTYGGTGLMAVQPWNNRCYGDVKPGTIFLFPGSEDIDIPYEGKSPQLNCSPRPPIYRPNSNYPSLHEQMCAILDQPTINFIGFAVKYPYNIKGNVGYNSGTCNRYWFGDRELPANWQNLVYRTLQSYLSRWVQNDEWNNRYFGSIESAPYYADSNEVYCPPEKRVIGFNLWRKNNRVAVSLLAIKPDGTGAEWVQNNEMNGNYFPIEGGLKRFYIANSPVICPSGKIVIGFRLRWLGSMLAINLRTINPDGSGGEWIENSDQGSWFGPIAPYYVDSNPVAVWDGNTGGGIFAGVALRQKGNRVAFRILVDL